MRAARAFSAFAAPVLAKVPAVRLPHRATAAYTNLVGLGECIRVDVFVHGSHSAYWDGDLLHVGNLGTAEWDGGDFLHATGELQDESELLAVLADVFCELGDENTGELPWPAALGEGWSR